MAGAAGGHWSDTVRAAPFLVAFFTVHTGLPVLSIDPPADSAVGMSTAHSGR